MLNYTTTHPPFFPDQRLASRSYQLFTAARRALLNSLASRVFSYPTLLHFFLPLPRKNNCINISIYFRAMPSNRFIY
jgi:hypothetical protein